MEFESKQLESCDRTHLLIRHLPATCTAEDVARWLTGCGIPLTPENVSVRNYEHVDASTAMVSIGRDIIAKAIGLFWVMFKSLVEPRWYTRRRQASSSSANRRRSREELEHYELKDSGQ